MGEPVVQRRCELREPQRVDRAVERDDRHGVCDGDRHCACGLAHRQENDRQARAQVAAAGRACDSLLCGCRGGHGRAPHYPCQGDDRGRHHQRRRGHKPRALARRREDRSRQDRGHAFDYFPHGTHAGAAAHPRSHPPLDDRAAAQPAAGGACGARHHHRLDGHFPSRSHGCVPAGGVDPGLVARAPVPRAQRLQGPADSVFYL
eukprot:Amastigsp_a678072_205.p2 type:complete len:204 gc:universal Amastigsp_a678072_205:400-1011(+)